MSHDALSAGQFQEIVQTLTGRAPGQEKFHLHGRLLRLPSRGEVHELVETLRALLFPGYYGSQPASRLTLLYHSGSLLEEFAGQLQTLIELCLAFQQHEPPEDNDVGERAGAVVAGVIRLLPQIQRQLYEDVQAAVDGDPACTGADEVICSYPGLLALTHHRLAHALHGLAVPLLPRMISELAHAGTGIDIHPGARVESALFIDHGTGVVIGETCVIGRRVKLYQGVTLGARSFPLDERGRPIKGIPRHPIVEDDVVIYSGATILGRITLGQGAVVGGNVWLTRSVPAGGRVFLKPAFEDSFQAGGGI
ncbi:MAG: DapH/DapD/GlmU-related protein [Candidatus Delongbacteria bacterium]